MTTHAQSHKSDKYILVDGTNFSIAQISASGQCFRMTEQENGWFQVIANGKCLRLKQETASDITGNEIRNNSSNTTDNDVRNTTNINNTCNSNSDSNNNNKNNNNGNTNNSNHGDILMDCSEEDFQAIWKFYFDLDTDYNRFLTSIDPADTYLRSAVAYGSGIRILRQDLWEMIISFIISQQNNIRRIRKCIETICTHYGTKSDEIDNADNSDNANTDSSSFYLFPTPEQLATATEDELRALGLGYRSRYLVETARSIASGEISLDALKEMDYPSARTELLKLCGVGAKVADCICLFGLHHLEAFPIDTHIRQVLTAHYPDGFPFESYSGYEGVLQQYIFYYDLNGND